MRFTLLFFLVLFSIAFLHADFRPKVHNGLTDFFSETFTHMGQFNKYLFASADTYKILVSSAPFYGIARGLVDCPLQNYFYDKKTHRNIHQIAPVFEHMVDPLLGLSIFPLLLLQFFTHDEETRLTSNVFLAALPFLWVVKDIIKELPFPGNIRPKNQHFSASKTYYGGFPSGHMFEATFMAYLFGAQLGINYAIPLSTLAFLIAIQSVAINRHTASQVVVGATFGCVFGAAAQKVVKNSLSRAHSLSMSANKYGGLSLNYEKTF